MVRHATQACSRCVPKRMTPGLPILVPQFEGGCSNAAIPGGLNNLCIRHGGGKRQKVTPPSPRA